MLPEIRFSNRQQSDLLGTIKPQNDLFGQQELQLDVPHFFRRPALEFTGRVTEKTVKTPKRVQDIIGAAPTPFHGVAKVVKLEPKCFEVEPRLGLDRSIALEQKGAMVRDL